MTSPSSDFQDIRNCRKCHEDGLLYNKAYPLFFESGNIKSDIIFILEAPNWDDSFNHNKRRLTYDDETDPTGRFVNACLRNYLKREPKSVYFTNAVLCLPKKNDNGKHDVKTYHIINCAQNISKIINRIDPLIVVTMGLKALEATRRIEYHSLMLSTSVSTCYKWYGRILFPMYHPSLLGRLPQNRREAKQQDDFMKLAQVMNAL